MVLSAGMLAVLPVLACAGAAVDVAGDGDMIEIRAMA